MDEFDLIDRIVSELGPATRGNSIVLGPGDDCAQVLVPRGYDLVSSIDTFVAGRHFPAHAGGDLVGYRVMAVNLSDLAAMGAQPSHALLAMTLPDIDVGWVDAFCQGVRKACIQFECPLAGGNITRGPLNVSVSVHGVVESAASLKRSGAKAGDLVYLTGSIGGAGLALEHPRFDEAWSLDGLDRLPPSDDCLSIQKYYMPQPRLAFGQVLLGLASAAIDVSDGLVADATHIARASSVGLALQLGDIPCFPGTEPKQAVVAGDDYELCFTVPEEYIQAVDSLASHQNIPIECIGRVYDGQGVQVHHQGSVVDIDVKGYQHFDST